MLAVAFRVLVLMALAVAVSADDFMQDRGIFQPLFFAELQDIEVDGDRAFIFGVGGLMIMNVSDPDQPFLLGRYNPPGGPYVRFYRGAVAGDYAYGGAREDLLMAINMTSSLAPYRTAVVGHPGMSYEGCAVEDGRLYACRHSDGLQILDLADPGMPEHLGEYPDLVNAWDVVVRNGLAYVADGLGGLRILDVSDPAAPALVASMPRDGAVVDVVLTGDLAILAMGSAGVDVVDVSDPAAPVWRGRYDSSGLAITVDAVGDRVFVADWDDVEVVDVSNPGQPVAAGFEDTPVRAMGLAADEDRVYVADWAKLRIYDFGATSQGDLQVPESMVFGRVDHGGVVDTTVTVANTGGGSLLVTDVQVFDDAFELQPPLNFVLGPGDSRDVPLRYTRGTNLFDATFLRVDAEDSDEPFINVPVTAGRNPSDLNVGQGAPNFTLQDMDGAPHTLSQYLGKVVVLAFFANW